MELLCPSFSKVLIAWPHINQHARYRLANSTLDSFLCGAGEQTCVCCSCAAVACLRLCPLSRITCVNVYACGEGGHLGALLLHALWIVNWLIVIQINTTLGLSVHVTGWTRPSNGKHDVKWLQSDSFRFYTQCINQTKKNCSFFKNGDILIFLNIFYILAEKKSFLIRQLVNAGSLQAVTESNTDHAPSALSSANNPSVVHRTSPWTKRQQEEGPRRSTGQTASMMAGEAGRATEDLLINHDLFWQSGQEMSDNESESSIL